MLNAQALLLSAFVVMSPAAVAQATDQELPEGILASINGRPIPNLSVDTVAQQLTASGQEADPERILEELINMEVLTQAAEALDLDKLPEISAALQLQYTQTMANAYLASKGAEISFSEEELRAEYASQSASVDRAEFRASHILLETKDVADEVVEKLATGTKFDELAERYSIDPAGENGGDLGWFQSSAMVPEFSAAVATMEIGDISDTPVKSEFGYHIIRLDDKRNAALPDFDSVKSGLTNLAMRKALANHVNELRSAAQIKLRK